MAGEIIAIREIVSLRLLAVRGSIARGDTKILGIAVSKNGYLTRQRLVSVEKLEILTFPHHDFLEPQTCDTAGNSPTHEIQ